MKRRRNMIDGKMIVQILILLVFCMASACNSEPKPEKKAPIETDWVFVEGGTFIMGTDHPLVSPKGDSIYAMLTPAREVKVSDFYIRKYEVTVQEFRAFCQATGRAMPKPPPISAYGDSIDFTWEDNYPMLLTWREADAFAKWAGGRLPTEAEWEYASLGGKKSKGFHYSGSDTAMVVGWVRENSDSTFHPVGLLRPNELGIYDMTGNLNEWVSDWWNPDYDYLSGPKVDPTGPPTGVEDVKVSKGVGWYYGAVNDETGEPLPYSIHRREVQYQTGMDERTYGFGARIAKDAH